MLTQRLRLTFSKGKAVRFVGHLDLVRTWERALRRAGVPLAYSRGFNPQPKLQFASALPVGATGRAEMADVLLSTPMSPEAFLAAVQPQLPAGLSLLAVAEAPLKSKALQALLCASEWRVTVQADEPATELTRRVGEFLARQAAPASRQRKGQTVAYDLRPLVLALSYEGENTAGLHELSMTLRSEPGATGRPDAVLAALGLAHRPFRMERVRCLFADETA